MKTLISSLLSIYIFLISDVLSAGINEDIDRAYGTQSRASNYIKNQVARLGEGKIRRFWLNSDVKALAHTVIPFSNNFPNCFQDMSFHLPQVQFDTSLKILSYWLKQDYQAGKLEDVHHSTQLLHILDIIILFTPILAEKFSQPLASDYFDYWINQISTEASEASEASKLNQLASNYFFGASQVALQVYFNQDKATRLIDFWSNNYPFLKQLNSPNECVIQTLIVTLPLISPARCPAFMQWLQSNINCQFTVQNLLAHPLIRSVINGNS